MLANHDRARLIDLLKRPVNARQCCHGPQAKDAMLCELQCIMEGLRVSCLKPVLQDLEACLNLSGRFCSKPHSPVQACIISQMLKQASTYLPSQAY